MEHKHFSFEIKEVNEEGMFKGYAAVFGNVDLGGDKIIQGAFKKTLQRTGGKIPIYADHKAHIGYGLEAEENNKGLLVKGQLNLDVELARDKRALARQAKEVGTAMGLSIGYDTVEREYVDDVRVLKEVELFEYSLTAIPMNPRALMAGMKSEGERVVVAGISVTENVRDFECFLRDAGFSRSEAKRIASLTFNQRDADLLDALRKAKNALMT